MPSEIVMPRMGLTMETGTIIHWLKQEGEPVTAGEPLLEIETDKASVEIEALESGTLYKVCRRPWRRNGCWCGDWLSAQDGESADAGVPALVRTADVVPASGISGAKDGHPR